jgi:hypothetical protein
VENPQTKPFLVRKHGWKDFACAKRDQSLEKETKTMDSEEGMMLEALAEA